MVVVGGGGGILRLNETVVPVCLGTECVKHFFASSPLSSVSHIKVEWHGKPRLNCVNGWHPYLKNACQCTALDMLV